MLVIRGFEERVAALYRDGEVPGFVHLSIGQEASAVGACWPLDPADVITSTHRGHGHCLAKGLDPLGMFAELMAKDAGTNRGRGGSMHIADPTLGIFGANGIVGAGLPIAAGAATAAQLRARRPRRGRVLRRRRGGARHVPRSDQPRGRVAVAGDLLLREQRLRRVLAASAQHAAPLERGPAGYGVDYVAVDGNDVVATASAMRSVVEATRAGRGPVIVEADDVPVARSLRRRPAALPIGRRSPGVGSARPAARPRAPAPVGGRHRRRARSRWSRGRARARRRGRGARRLPAPAARR